MPHVHTLLSLVFLFLFFFTDTSTTEIYTLSLHDALPIYPNPLPEGEGAGVRPCKGSWQLAGPCRSDLPKVRSEEHTSELQSLRHLVCRLLLEKKKIRLETRPLH